MKTFLNKNRYGFAFFFLTALFFLLKVPSYQNGINANVFFGREIIHNENGAFLLCSLFKNANEKTVWSVTLILYILFILLASYLLGRAIEKTPEDKRDIAIVLCVFLLTAPVGISAVGELRIFGLVFAALCFFGAILCGLLFQEKSQVAVICVTILCALIHPLLSICLFPPMFFVLYYKNKKEKTIFSMFVMGSCYLINLILALSLNFSGTQFKTNFIKGFLSVLFLSPLIILFIFVWANCIRHTDKKTKNLYICAAVSPVLSLPAVFVCNTFFISLFSMVCGQLFVFLFLFSSKDKPFCMALEKTAEFFRRNSILFLSLIAYMILLGNTGDDAFGVVGNLIGGLMSR